jgi:hypothetical protein
MGNIEEQILRASKEIIVKFIETGRVSPTSFSETFKNIYDTIEEAVKGPRTEPPRQQSGDNSQTGN